MVPGLGWLVPGLGIIGSWVGMIVAWVLVIHCNCGDLGFGIVGVVASACYGMDTGNTTHSNTYAHTGAASKRRCIRGCPGGSARVVPA